ncbi:bifunctional biotin--[acetyl-CoA-carboxylase] ligase/biotin operon repressor BirA [Streptococcus ovuberis]|uniref:Bifunctional ligase/repressor BirA n=1 Tax=Streptococcus ovuberis TaxID=1936207 RepID=A0A7X6S0R1_9STRE|nr:bifunctional biotin--[acetyl-CoA-carboxylase] ligase/biotin operon repressor BirA [Streptococcus ovuberis]NKZ20042.1 bifunctional biotin--[acetyl-CoA-carboxylase] ligase/biotin operon repressor BirA [Streptococcus ovuberis]
MKTYEKVYQLLSTTTDYLSGEQLAEQLNLSRTSIWKAIQQLEKQGLVIESTKHLGYRLREGDLLLPDELSDQLGLEVVYTQDSQSTQMDAKKGIEAGHEGNCLYLAPSQGGARGRFGRAFFAPKHGGIYMSLHLKPMLAHAELPSYTLLVAASIVKAIQDLTGIETQIKWVNDIYLGQKKIAGILTEAITSVETGVITDIIIGVGLNFLVKAFPEELANKATSLFEERPNISRNDLILAIWKTFFETPEDTLIQFYKEHSLVLGKTVTFQKNGQSLTGRATALNDQGQLQIILLDGQELWLNSGEISLTSWTNENKPD